VRHFVEAVHESVETGHFGGGRAEVILESAVFVALVYVRNNGLGCFGTHFFVVGSTVGFGAVGRVALIDFCG